MNDTSDSRLRIRFVLIAIILATFPCYCAGLALVQLAGQGTPTPAATYTPAWMKPVTPTLPLLVFPTSTPPLLPPTLTLPPTGTPTSTSTPTSTPTWTPTPTDTPLPTFTLPPIPTQPPVDTLPPYPIFSTETPPSP